MRLEEEDKAASQKLLSSPGYENSVQTQENKGPATSMLFNEEKRKDKNESKLTVVLIGIIIGRRMFGVSFEMR